MAIAASIFLLSGISKALHSRAFLEQLRLHRLLPAKTLPALALAIIGLEWALAITLFSGHAPSLTIPTAMTLLIGFSLITLRGHLKNRIGHCGCYGQIFFVTPAQSITIHLSAALLLWIPMILIESLEPSHLSWPQIILFGGLGIFIAGRSTDKPLLDFSESKPGKNWSSHWLPKSNLENQISAIVAFLHPNCEHCKRFIEELRNLETSPFLQILIVTPPDHDENPTLKSWRTEFTTREMELYRYQSLTFKSPTTLWLVDGKIHRRWVGVMPTKMPVLSERQVAMDEKLNAFYGLT